MTVMLLAMLAALIVSAGSLLQRYLERLPVAPACPACGGITHATGMGALPARLLPALAATGVRDCRRCGWHGRMRWRLAPRRVAGDPLA